MIKPISHYAIACGCPAPTTPAEPSREYVPRAWLTRYDEITPTEGEILLTMETGAYTPQGACTDGKYIYRALVANDTEPTWLQKIDIATGEIVKESVNTSFGHANDMCYRDGKLYIAHSASTSTVYTVGADSFELLETHELPLTIWGIDYDPVNDLFVLGGVGSAYFSIYYPDFEFMYRIKPENPFYGLVRQGIACDSNYIYVALDNAYGTLIENEKGSRVMVYTWNGIFVKSYYIPIKEIESVFVHDGKMYIGTYEGRSPADIKSGVIYACTFDLYPEQTVITGRPTEVSGGINNLQRLPEGTPVRLWVGEESDGGAVLKLTSSEHGLTIDENSPFRYLRFRFKGANQGVFDWYPLNTGVVCIREVDVIDSVGSANPPEVNEAEFRIREMRLSFNATRQEFKIDTNMTTEVRLDNTGEAPKQTVFVTKHPNDSLPFEPMVINQIWGVI